MARREEAVRGIIEGNIRMSSTKLMHVNYETEQRTDRSFGAAVAKG